MRDHTRRGRQPTHATRLAPRFPARMFLKEETGMTLLNISAGPKTTHTNVGAAVFSRARTMSTE